MARLRTARLRSWPTDARPRTPKKTLAIHSAPQPQVLINRADIALDTLLVIPCGEVAGPTVVELNQVPLTTATTIMSITLIASSNTER